MTVTSDTADNPSAPAAGWNTNVPDSDLAAFEDVRPRLFGLAYRMLGSVAEAEDVVQDAWLRWQGTDRRVVRNPAAFLTTTTTRLAINATTSAHARRETYIGPWLPEPVDTSADPALGAERAEALEMAVLLLLEKLGPTERAAYVLREAFGYSYREIADVLDTSEVNARQVARRAREHLDSERSAPATPAQQRRLLESFVAAARVGDLDGLERLLVDDVVVRPDGGGEVHASRVELVGAGAHRHVPGQHPAQVLAGLDAADRGGQRWHCPPGHVGHRRAAGDRRAGRLGARDRARLHPGHPEQDAAVRPAA